VGGLAHVLGAAGEDHRALAQEQAVRALHKRLEARAAEAVHGDRRGGHRGADLEADVPGEVDRVGARLHDVAEDDVVNVLSVYPSLGQGGLGGDDAQLRRAHVGERAVEGAEGGALGAEEDDGRMRRHLGLRGA
jgi:hypothetical protein